ncbi:DUF305 domain-containing protein [Arthrobacter sp. BE255]|uniref:DUF305 domain-containing protein n=1 Tax=Arthrobacter sp. BE255 TaxID=2817721 RepID=UPI002854FEC4|nr:DUF305 domain-containing protein [Arthrobacter sp. BE255]MDR7160057.1 uncharacterized protein (DUF305 family) [Arthrobacter sp. BE255]
MNTKTLSVAAILAAAISLAGCAAGTATTPSHGMDHGSSSPMSSMMPDAAADHNAADIMFSQMMIPHHAQAVEMSDIMLAKPGIPAAVTSLATRIKAAQAPEIEQMTGWLEDWNQPTGMMTGHSMPGGGMSGMVSGEDLDKLKAAQGDEAAKLFLTQMIAHHEGAIAMARTEVDSGEYSETITLAKAIITAQEAEIEEMKQLLATS